MKSIRATLAAVALLALVSASSASNSKDREALLSIMASFPPNPFHPFHSWNSSADCCVWEFVQCSDGRVTLLQITDIDLGGQIPLSLARLPKLTQLFLRNLNLSGPIPRQLSRLRNLDVLYLDNNRLTGTIPASLFSRSNSTDIRLVLSSNSLAGRIPRSFGRLEFAILDLSNNKLTGDASLLFATTMANLRRSLLHLHKTLTLARLTPQQSLCRSPIGSTYRFYSDHGSIEIDLSTEESKRRLHNRLLYRSRQRGFLELDLVLGNWVEENIKAMDEPKIRALVDVLDLENPDLWKWLSGQEQPPEAVNRNPVFEAVRSKVVEILNHAAPETRATPGQPWVRGWDDKRGLEGGPKYGNQ